MSNRGKDQMSASLVNCKLCHQVPTDLENFHKFHLFGGAYGLVFFFLVLRYLVGSEFVLWMQWDIF